MKDELSMKSPVSPIEGSRFTPASLAADKIGPVLLPSAPGAGTRVLPARFAVSLPEESMVVDDRSHLTPSQVVENKLINRLRESSLPISHLQMRGLVRNRYEA